MHAQAILSIAVLFLWSLLNGCDPADKATVKIMSDVPCEFYVDGQKEGAIKGDEMLRLRLRPGEYRFKAVSTTNLVDEVEALYRVGQAGTEVIYTVKLQDVIEARSQVERAEPEMIFIAGGAFTMGCTSEQGVACIGGNSLAHRVTMSAFFLSKYEVTQELWTTVMGSTVAEQRDKVDPEYPLNGEGGHYPMYYVNWGEAQEFIRKLNKMTGKNYRLPSEAEWEYAARGGSQSRGTRYAGSNEINSVAWHGDNSYSATHAVGQKAPNELGLYDMSGNVSEWCMDWYEWDYYESSPSKDPQGPSNGRFRVVRGGSWFGGYSMCKVGKRDDFSPGHRSGTLGFRLAITQ